MLTLEPPARAAAASDDTEAKRAERRFAGYRERHLAMARHRRELLPTCQRLMFRTVFDLLRPLVDRMCRRPK